MADLEFYCQFMDDLVSDLSESIAARRFLAGVWHREPPPDQEKYNRLLNSLTEEQRSILAELFREERTAGIHDLLVYLEERELTIQGAGGSFCGSPFGTGMHFDYVARLAGDEWPDPD